MTLSAAAAMRSRKCAQSLGVLLKMAEAAMAAATDYDNDAVIARALHTLEHTAGVGGVLTSADLPPVCEDALFSSDTCSIRVLEADDSAVLKKVRERFAASSMWVARRILDAQIVGIDYESMAGLQDVLEETDVSLRDVHISQEYAVVGGDYPRRIEEEEDEDEDASMLSSGQDLTSEQDGDEEEEEEEAVAALDKPPRIELTEFFLEAAVGRLVNTALLDCGMTPHVIRTRQCFAHEGRGYLVLDRADGCLSDALQDRMEGVRLRPEDVAGVYVQVLHALQVAQNVLGLKHHDLHTNNVFLKRLRPGDTWRGADLYAATHFKYMLNDTALYVPNTTRCIPWIADYGFCSVFSGGVRLERADLTAFGVTSPGSDTHWGDWSPELRGCRGYDAQVLVGDAACTLQRKRLRLAKSGNLRALHSRMAAALGWNPRKPAGRPKVVSDVPPGQVLRAVFLEEPADWHDFRLPPLGKSVRVVDMSELRDSP
jgi:hypothetical protein